VCCISPGPTNQIASIAVASRNIESSAPVDITVAACLTSSTDTSSGADRHAVCTGNIASIGSLDTSSALAGMLNMQSCCQYATCVHVEKYDTGPIDKSKRHFAELPLRLITERSSNLNLSTVKLYNAGFELFCTVSFLRQVVSFLSSCRLSHQQLCRYFLWK
jgi:hypothetical protein